MIRITQRFIVLPLLIAVIIHVFMTIRKSRHERRRHFFVDLLFISYSVIVIGLLYLPLTINNSGDTLPPLNLNLIPLVNLFRSIFPARIGFDLHTALVAIANFVLFIPMSAYLVARHGNHPGRNLALAITISLCAEIVQLLLVPIVGYQDHVFDIDDAILNCTGCVASFLYFNRTSMRTEDSS